MRLPERSRGDGLKFSLTPLIDVVFNLVIFFLAASHLAQSTDTEAIELPAASTSRPPEAPVPGELTLTVLPTGEYRVQGRTLSLGDADQWLAGHIRGAGDPQALELRIRADRKTVFRHLAPLLEKCVRRGVTRIRFATEQATREAR
jgi:biopolymer transport protein ExbD